MSDNRRQKERQELEYESAREWAKRQDSGGRTSVSLPEGASWFSVKKAGNYYVDVIPYRAGKGNPDCGEGKVFWTRIYWTHRGVGAGNEVYCCPRRCTNGKVRCPICEDVDRRLRELSTDLEGEALKKARKSITDCGAKMRQLLNVIDVDSAEKGIQIWDVSWHLFGKTLKTMLDNMDADEDFDWFFHPKKGKTLKITSSEESGGGFTFYDCSSITFKDRKEPYEMAVIEDAHCLDAMLKIPTYEQLLRVFLQVPDDDPLPDENASGRRMISPGGNGAKKKPQDDDLDDLPPVRKTKPAPGDDEDELPVRKAKAAAPDDDEDDAPPPPKKVNKAQTAEEAGLKLKQTVRYKDAACVVSKISRDGTSLTLTDVDDEDEVHYAVAPWEVEPLAQAKVGKASADDDDDDQEDDDDDAPPPPKKKPKK